MNNKTFLQYLSLFVTTLFLINPMRLYICNKLLGQLILIDNDGWYLVLDDLNWERESL